jgi:hypothetical protein
MNKIKPTSIFIQSTLIDHLTCPQQIDTFLLRRVKNRHKKAQVLHLTELEPPSHPKIYVNDRINVYGLKNDHENLIFFN